MMDTPRLQDSKPLKKNEGSKKQKALKNNIKRFLPRDHVSWNNRTEQNTVREKLSMVTSGNGKF